MQVYPNTHHKSVCHSANFYVRLDFYRHTVAGDRKTKVIILCIKRTHYSECIQAKYSTIYTNGVSSFSLQRCAVTYIHTVMAGLLGFCTVTLIDKGPSPDGQLLSNPTGFNLIRKPWLMG